MMSVTVIWPLTISVLSLSSVMMTTTTTRQTVTINNFDAAIVFDIWSFGFALMSVLLARLVHSWLDECIFGLMHVMAAVGGNSVSADKQSVAIQGFDHQVAYPT